MDSRFLDSLFLDSVLFALFLAFVLFALESDLCVIFCFSLRHFGALASLVASLALVVFEVFLLDLSRIFGFTLCF